MRLYLDSAPTIYYVERVRPYILRLEPYLDRMDLELVSSQLTRMECRVRPLRDQAGDLLTAFDRFFDIAISAMVPLDAEVFEHATSLRAMHGFATPDALHLAAAIAGGCQVFLTNDQRLARCAEIRVELVRDVDAQPGVHGQ